MAVKRRFDRYFSIVCSEKQKSMLSAEATRTDKSEAEIIREMINMRYDLTADGQSREGLAGQPGQE